MKVKKTKPLKTKPVYDGPMPVVVYEDDSVVVVNKPAGLTTMRHADEAAEFGEKGKKFLPTTLADLLPDLLGQPGKPLRAVHRIDRDTSGLVVFARKAKAERSLLEQFRHHSIERRYWRWSAASRKRARSNRNWSAIAVTVGAAVPRRKKAVSTRSPTSRSLKRSAITR